MSPSTKTLPPLFPRQHQTESVGNGTTEPVELALTPTWPMHLPESTIPVTGQQTTTSYLELSQMLQWEMWAHNQTRIKLSSELGQSAWLCAQVHKLSNELAYWRNAGQTGCVGPSTNQAKHGQLYQEARAVTAEAISYDQRERKVRKSLFWRGIFNICGQTLTLNYRHRSRG
jgi:hypothetical protein